jgi:hypothetical protein
MEYKRTKIVNKSNDALKSINGTNKCTHGYCEDNNNNHDYDYNELAYHFSKRIKVKHEPEEAQENNPVKYTADIIVEIKKMAQWCP